jgi:hypothetical protein
MKSLLNISALFIASLLAGENPLALVPVRVDPVGDFQKIGVDRS